MEGVDLVESIFSNPNKEEDVVESSEKYSEFIQKVEEGILAKG